MEQNLLDIYRQTVPNHNLELIPLQFVCDVFGIDFKYQSTKLSKDDTYEGHLRLKANTEVFDDGRQRYHLNKKGFIRWIMQLNPNTVKPELRDDFTKYQSNIVDYLYDNAIQQETILKRAQSLKQRKEVLFNKLYADNDDFIEYIGLQAEIARLGKDNKIIQQKIAGGQLTFDL